jgi:hypothetical protein
MTYEYTITANYKPGEPVQITDDQSASAFLDDLFQEASRSVDSTAAMLYINERPKEADGLADHELCIGVNPKTKTGSLAYTDRDGQFYAVGRTSARDQVVYFCQGYDEYFPQDSELDLPELLTAVQEMLRIGERPKNVAWASIP